MLKISKGPGSQKQQTAGPTVSSCSLTYYISVTPKVSAHQAPLAAQMVKNLRAVWEIQVRYLGQEDPLEKEMATHSSLENSKDWWASWPTVHVEAETWDLTDRLTSLAHGDTGNVLSSKTSSPVPIFSAFLQYQKTGMHSPAPSHHPICYGGFSYCVQALGHTTFRSCSI